MPHNESLSPKKHAFRVLFGQLPLTRFKDYRSNIKVDLTYAPPRESIMKAVYDFCKATWSEDGKESERATPEMMSEAFSTMLEGKALGLGIETIDFIFRINGITRVDTHQIVRQRIGITYSQQCTGDRFLNHNDVLVEECIAQDEELLKQYISATLKAKNCYQELNDSFKISIQTAREVLPHNLETFIFVKINLMTLLEFYKKRIDDGSQTWPINEVAKQMADEVCKIYPELRIAFDKRKTAFKFQTEAAKDRNNNFSTSLYIPKNNDEFDYHDRDFLYDQKKIDMNYTNTPMSDKFYWGYTEVTEEVFNQIKEMYAKLDSEIHENNWSNKEIWSKANDLNFEIGEKFSL